MRRRCSRYEYRGWRAACSCRWGGWSLDRDAAAEEGERHAEGRPEHVIEIEAVNENYTRRKKRGLPVILMPKHPKKNTKAKRPHGRAPLPPSKVKDGKEA